MIKVLILAYDFPPYVSVGALRPYSWYKYFSEFDIYPVVITRQWDNKYGNHLDYIAPGESMVNIVEESEIGTIVRTPYTTNLANRILLKYGEKKFRFIRKLITAYYEFAQFFFLVGPKSHLYFEAKSFMDKNKIDLIIATGEPFILFKYASKLSSNYRVPWIADYRDTWSQTKLRSPNRFLKIWNSYLEKVNLKNASAITTVSEFCKTKILSLLKNKKVYIIKNGYDPETRDIMKDMPQQGNKLSIAFIGTIYKWHPLESFLRTISIFINENGSTKLSLKFYGTNSNEEIRSLVNIKYPNLKEHIFLFNKISNSELLPLLAPDNLMLLFNDYSLLGTKIFDYLAIKRKIILCYTDDNEAKALKASYFPEEKIEKESDQLQADLLKETNAGIPIKNSEHLANVMEKLFVELSDKGYIKCDSVNIEQYSRKYQTKKMTEIIYNILERN